MSEPAFIISGGVTGAMISQWLPGVEPPMVLASLTGSFIFFAVSNNYTIIKRLGLFLTSFLSGLMFTNTADGIYSYHFHSVIVEKPVWAFIISAMVVTVIVGVINWIKQEGVIKTLLMRLFNINKGGDS